MSAFGHKRTIESVAAAKLFEWEGHAVGLEMACCAMFLLKVRVSSPDPQEWLLQLADTSCSRVIPEAEIH